MHPRLMPQVASGSTQALAHAITRGVATTRTRSVVSLVERTRGVPVGFVGVSYASYGSSQPSHQVRGVLCVGSGQKKNPPPVKEAGFGKTRWNTVTLPAQHTAHRSECQ